ncbi:hypothetical protein ACAG25_22275 [Mycobacterium sp. pV006]|uniref:hypothetical protein n=1 Tax=Mycobacterium sp. pV006 TaxID=3238983 RepID=UPI00351AC3FE
MSGTQSSTENAYLPGSRRWRAADLSVLLLVIVALVCAIVLRQLNVNATQSASFGDVVFEVPRRSIVESTTDAYVATAPGMTVRVEKLPTPSGPAGESGDLAASRALQQAQSRTLYQVSGTQAVQADGRDAEVLSYQYVDKSSQAFATGLRVIVGNELLVPGEQSYYAVALEGPSDRRAELEAMWPKIQSSVSLGG